MRIFLLAHHSEDAADAVRPSEFGDRGKIGEEKKSLDGSSESQEIFFCFDDFSNGNIKGFVVTFMEDSFSLSFPQNDRCQPLWKVRKE